MIHVRVEVNRWFAGRLTAEAADKYRHREHRENESNSVIGVRHEVVTNIPDEVKEVILSFS